MSQSRQGMVITRFGGTDVLRLENLAPETPGPGRIRIRVRAAGVNFADVMMRMGMYPEAPKPPFVPGYEVSGEVAELGPGVTGLAEGDRVLAGCRFGGYATEINVPADSARKLPSSLSFEQGASIPVNFITAWIALHEMGRVRSGDRVAIQSAAGGVGVAAVQIATGAGAQVTGLVGSLGKAEKVRELGARDVLTNGDWDQGEDSQLGGYDLILDSQGGEHLKRSYRRLAAAGRVVTFGVSDMVGSRKSLVKAASFILKNPLFPPLKLMMDNRGVFGLNLLQIFNATDPATLRLSARVLDGVMAGFEEGRFRPVVGKSFPLEKAGEAHDYLLSRANIGKVVLTVG
jgi:NADPH:quinone reductase-like Zn-dependent oxidoreductase